MLLLATAESPLVDELRKFLLHHFFDLGNGLFQASLGRAGHVEI